MPGADAVVFVDDQDTQRAGRALSNYAYSSCDQGPPSTGGNAIAASACGTGTWQCEQRWPAIAGLVGWHNAAGQATVTIAAPGTVGIDVNAMAATSGSGPGGGPVTETVNVTVPVNTSRKSSKL